MRFTDDVNWTASDFLFAALAFGTVGVLIELAVRRSVDRAYRGGAIAAILAAFMVLWVNAAVGMIGTEDNGCNLLFGVPIVVALLGSIAAQFRSRGMSVAMIATAAIHIPIALGGLGQDPRGAVFSLLLSPLWIAAAALFRGASRHE